MTAADDNDQAEPPDGGAEPPRPSDEQVLQHLGGAVLLCWNELSFQCQNRILAQANDVIGLTPLPGARNEIVKLLLRRAKN
jgi:hypothetical protein